MLNLQFQGTFNTVRLYGPPQPSTSTLPSGSSKTGGYNQALGSSQAGGSSHLVGSSSRPLTRSRNIVQTVEKAIEVFEAD
jgi:hypothetical protein